MDCQLEIAARRRLPFSLPKLDFFPDRVDFVGVNIGNYYTIPAKSKHELLKTWLEPIDVWAVAAFITFELWPKAADDAWNCFIDAICSDPFLDR